MMYENIVLKAWNATWQREDPFKLGSAGTFSSADNALSGRDGHLAKFGLSTAIMKVAADKTNDQTVYDKLVLLDQEVWEAKTVNDLCNVLGDTKKLFNEIGIVIV